MEVQDWGWTKLDKPYNGMQQADSRKGRADTTLEKVVSRGHKITLSAKTPFHAAMEENQLKSKTKQSMAEQEEDKAVHGTAVNGKLGC